MPEHSHRSNPSQTNDANSALDALFWRDEILQVMFWLQGEDLGESVNAQELLVFLSGDLQTIQLHLEQAVEEGYLNKSPRTPSFTDATQYKLTDMGRREGGRRFQDEFAGMQKSGHGECSADCSCHQTGDHANCPSHGHQH